jgi:hypothetical protein
VLVLRTLAVAVIVMVTGLGPQENVIMPPAATAATTACDVQLAAVPFPMTRVGVAALAGDVSVFPFAAARDVTTGRAAVPQPDMAATAASALNNTAALRMHRMGPHASRGTVARNGVFAQFAATRFSPMWWVGYLSHD